MKIIKFENNFILRLDTNEEIISSIETFCISENIKTAFISGIGALKSVCIGRYEMASKEFVKKDFVGEFEVVSLQGNITVKEQDDINVHLHIALADKNFNLFGGHLVNGTVSATMEIIITHQQAIIKRKYNQETGLFIID